MKVINPVSTFVVACFLALTSMLGAQVTNSISIPFTTVDCPASLFTQVNDLNKYGKIVGVCVDPSGTHGFQTESGRLSLIDVPGATATGAIATNSLGTVVGIYLTPDRLQHGFSLKGNVFTTIDIPVFLGTSTSITGINDAGDIVGTYFDTSFRTQSFLFHQGQFLPIVFPGSVSTAVFSINGTSQMVGYYSTNSGIHGFLLSNSAQTTIDAANALFTIPTSISNNGSVLGYYEDNNLQTHLLFFKNGRAQTIDLQGGTLTVLHFERFAINNTGRIAGAYQDSSGNNKSPLHS